MQEATKRCFGNNTGVCSQDLRVSFMALVSAHTKKKQANIKHGRQNDNMNLEASYIRRVAAADHAHITEVRLYRLCFQLYHGAIM